MLAYQHLGITCTAHGTGILKSNQYYNVSISTLGYHMHSTWHWHPAIRILSSEWAKLLTIYSTAQPMKHSENLECSVHAVVLTRAQMQISISAKPTNHRSSSRLSHFVVKVMSSTADAHEFQYAFRKYIRQY